MLLSEGEARLRGAISRCEGRGRLKAMRAEPGRVRRSVGTADRNFLEGREARGYLRMLPRELEGGRRLECVGVGVVRESRVTGSVSGRWVPFRWCYPCSFPKDGVSRPLGARDGEKDLKE